jgi:hypothetical protein
LSVTAGNILESNCKRCGEYESQSHEDLDELRSARKLIKILQKALSVYPSTNNAYENDPVSSKTSSKPENSKKWFLVTARNQTFNPNKSNKHTAATSDQTVRTANWFSLLSKLQVDNIDLHGPPKQDESIPVQSTHNAEKHHKIGIKIPTILNGTLSYNDNRNSTLAKKTKTMCVSGSNCKEHKVRVVGDSHLKGSARRIDQFITSKF